MSQCESCSMPLSETTASKQDARYCVYCQDQESGELKSWEEVREGSVQAAVSLMGKSREEAEAWADTTLPNLPRWQKKEE